LPVLVLVGSPEVARHRRRWVIRAMSVAGVAAVAVAGLASSGGSPQGDVPSPGPAIGQQLDAPLPSSLLEAPLVLSTGRTVRLADFAGKILVISDVMTLCQETCPLDTANVVAAAREVEQAGLGDEVEFLSITLDPERDTPGRLAAYRQLYGQAPGDWLTVTGDQATLASLWDRLGVYIEQVPDTPPAPMDWLTGRPLTYDITHSDEIFFLGPDQKVRFLLDGAPQVAGGAPIPPALRNFLSGEATHTSPTPTPTRGLCRRSSR
jgi:protein SCO1/2